MFKQENENPIARSGIPFAKSGFSRYPHIRNVFFISGQYVHKKSLLISVKIRNSFKYNFHAKVFEILV